MIKTVFFVFRVVNSNNVNTGNSVCSQVCFFWGGVEYKLDAEFIK